MTKRKGKSRPKLLMDEIGPTLDAQVAAILSRPLPPDADELQRFCYQFLEESQRASLAAPTAPPKRCKQRTKA